DQDRRRRTGDARHVVVLSDPVAGEAELLDVAGGFPGDAERLADRAAFAHGNQVEHRELHVLQGVHVRSQASSSTLDTTGLRRLAAQLNSESKARPVPMSRMPAISPVLNSSPKVRREERMATTGVPSTERLASQAGTRSRM